MIPHNIFETKVVIEYLYCVHRLLSLRKQQHYLEYSIVFTIILDDNYKKHSKKKKRKSTARITANQVQKGGGREISCANGTGYSLGFIFDDV